jgi:cation diffusion facilitator family transporter
MHQHDLGPFRHAHDFRPTASETRERALLQVTLLTLLTMVVELAAGWWTGSLALTADGWHMGTHALALGGAALAYRWSRQADARGDARYAFGGWKIEVLAGYTSALALGAAALWLVVEAVGALREPQAIAFGEAMTVAALGLAVNLASAWMLARGSRTGHPAHGHSQHDHHGHGHGHSHGHAHDHNFSAAYLHVLADALTSVLAIAALAGGLWFGWAWLDPLVALVGAGVIAVWALGLLRHTARVLVDATGEPELLARVREVVEADGDAQVADLHLWQVGSASWSVVLTVVADRPLTAAAYRARVEAIERIDHVTVEVHRCTGPGDHGPVSR